MSLLELVKPYLPSVQERGRYTGPFSTFAEYHSFGIGFIVMLTAPELMEEVTGYAIGVGSGKVRKSGHMTDVAKEPAYLAIGAGLAILVRSLGVA